MITRKYPRTQALPMREAITSETDKDTHPDDLNNYKIHICICEKPIYFVFLQMLSTRRAGMLYKKS